MKREFRLANSSDIQRVRRSGKSYAHPLLVLITMPNDKEISRIGVIASRAVGGAVQRNRARRRLRAAFQEQMVSIQPGWDIIVLARALVLKAEYTAIQQAVLQCLQRADILRRTPPLGEA